MGMWRRACLTLGEIRRRKEEKNEMKSKLSRMWCIWGPREEMEKKEKDIWIQWRCSEQKMMLSLLVENNRDLGLN